MMAECLMSKSNVWKMKVQNAMLRGENITAPATVYIALYTSDPTGADTGQEVSGGDYARQPVTFAAPTIDGDVSQTSNADDISFPVATDDWGDVTHMGLRTAATGGELIAHGALKNPRTIMTGDLVRFFAGNVVVKEG